MSVLTSSLLRCLMSHIFSISRRAWIFLSVTFFIFLALPIWATISAAGFAAVLKHYADKFAEQGYRQNLIGASVREERHEYVKGSDSFSLIFAVRNREILSVDLSAWQLEKSMPRPGLAV